ncbi:MAG: hypothetical protein ABH806_00635 [Candidatus Omnitrophota bacterium]
MDIIVFLFMNCIVAASSFIFVYKLFKVSDFTDSLICWFIIYFAQIVSTELLLGAFGVLYLKNIILLNLSILLAIWYGTRKYPSAFDLSPARSIISGILNSRIMLFIACVILSFAAVKVFINLVNPPFGWDSLNYHFTFPVEWMKHANLNNPIVISDDPSPTYYPIGGSLFYLWLIFPLKSVFLADIGQIPFFILAFLSVYSISLKLDLSERYSFYAAALFCIIPNFFKQLQIAYLDVMVAALFLSSLNSLFLLSREFSFRNILFFSFSLGLFLSLKTVALPYSILLFLPFVLVALKNYRRFYLFIIAVFVVIALGGFSYIRNFIEAGNPMYPLSMVLFGNPVFKGVIDSSVYRVHFKTEDYRIAKLLFHEGMGLQSLLFILPSAFLALPVAVAKKIKRLTPLTAYCMILPILIYLIYRYVIPLPNTRYLYPLLGVGMISGFYLARAMNIPGKIVNIAVIICTLSSMAELAKRQELVVSILLTFILFLVFILLIRRRISIRIPLAAAALSACLVILLVCLNNDYIKNEYPRYTKMVKYSGFWPDATYAWNWLNRNTQGDNIAYVGRPVPFPLYGTNFKNNVYYVSVNSTEPVKLHYFPGSSYSWGYDFLSLHRNLRANGNYRGNVDYSLWLNNLIQRDTDYLFVYSLHQTKDLVFPVEDKWARADPLKFSPVFTNQSIHIYKIIR